MRVFAANTPRIAHLFMHSSRCVCTCRSEDEQAANGAVNGTEQQHMSAKDTARAAQRAAAMEKFNNQIRQLDDMVSMSELCCNLCRDLCRKLCCKLCL
jgi:hypothetical protein